MRVNYRQQTKTQINAKLKLLVNDGYVIKSGTSWKITQSGLQTLSEIERQLNECSFKLRKSDVQKILVKRPKTL
jgi:predicted transcriptional regulator